MPQLVRVKIIAELGKYSSVVEFVGQKYLVKTNTLNNYITQSTADGFITYAYINNVYLIRKWQ